MPLFEFLDHRGGTDVSHAGRVANPTGIHGHIDHLIFDRRGLAGIGVVKQKGVTSIEALAAAVALLALWSFAMSHNIGPLAGGTV
jgi:hypothetical protein